MRPVLSVLYGEDNPAEADRARAYFAGAAPEFALEIVHRASDFLPLAGTGRHAALVLAQQLPGAGALDVLRSFGSENVDIPVVLLGEPDDAAFAAAALRLGANDLIAKREGYLAVLCQRLRAILQRQAEPGALSPLRVPSRRVLLVDDRYDEAEKLVQELAKADAPLVVGRADGLEAASALWAGGAHFDLLLVAHRRAGFDAAALVGAARGQGFRGPVILIVERLDEAGMDVAYRVGAADYVQSDALVGMELALRIDRAADRHQLGLANERVADELAQRQRTLAALRQSEKQLNLALEAGRIGLWSWQVDTGQTHFSHRWKAQIGYADDEVRNDSAEWESRCHPEDLQHLKLMTARYLASPWPDYSIEYRMRHRDGSWRWFLLHADLELDERGRPVRILGSQIDVTALKQQQAELASTSGRLQQLSRRLLEVQELERRHLARELHDEIGQVLTVAKIHLQSTALSPEATKLAARIREPVVLLDRLLAQVRSLSLNLRPPLLDDLGLVPALHWLLQQPPPGGQAPRLQLATDPAPGRFDPTLETACFRIAQEALTNALRHARAKAITVSLSVHEGKLRLGVRDDGTGFDAAAARNRSEAGGSLGLLGMHERALLAGGALTLLSAPGRGTEVEAVFPLSNPAESL